MPKLMEAGLKEKPGVGTVAVLPPPPQDVDHKVMARQAVPRIAAFLRCR